MYMFLAIQWSLVYKVNLVDVKTMILRPTTMIPWSKTIMPRIGFFITTLWSLNFWSLASNYLYSWPWSLSMIKRRKKTLKLNNFYNKWAQHMSCMANMDFAHGIVVIQSSSSLTKAPWSWLFDPQWHPPNLFFIVSVVLFDHDMYSLFLWSLASTKLVCMPLHLFCHNI